MTLLYVIVIGVVIGIAGRYVFAHRDLTGILLVPAIGICAASLVWILLTLLGWSWSSGWIWLVTILATGVLVTASSLVLTRTRAHADDNRYAALTAAR